MHINISHTPKQILQAYKYPTLILALGVCISLILFQFALRYELRQTTQNFQNLSQQIFRTLNVRFLLHKQQISILASFTDATKTNNISTLGNTLNFNTNFIHIFETTAEQAKKNPTLYPKLHQILENGVKDVFYAPPRTEPKSETLIMPVIAKIPNKPGHFLIGLINLSGLFEQEFFPHTSRMPIHVLLKEPYATTLIFDQAATHSTQDYTSSPTNQNMSFKRHKNFDNFSLELRTFIPAHDYHYTIGLFPWSSLTLSLSLTFLMGYLALRITNENIKTQKIVEKQTAHLREYTKRLEASNQDLDNFVHIASHDLKEPLRGIRNFAALLIEDYQSSLNPEIIRKLQTMQTLSFRMEHLINTLMEYSMISRDDLTIQSVNMSELAHEAMTSISQTIQSSNAFVSINPNMPTIECDRMRVGEVFTYLVTNAIKYNEQEQKNIEISYTTQHPQHKNTNVFFVRDNGIGIAPEDYKTIFKIFRRLHGREKFGGGYGSGLTIAEKIIQRHNGQLWIEPNPDGGSIFYFILNRI